MTPWPPDVIARYVGRGLWEGRDLGSYIVDAARRRPEAICLVDGPTRFTYRELLSRADGAADRLRTLGLRPDDRLVVQLPNCWEHVVLTLACLRLGVLPVWTLPQHGIHELTGLAAQAQARAIVVPDRHKDVDHQALAHEVAAAVASVEFVLVAGAEVAPSSVDLHAVLAPAEDPQRLAAELDAAAPDGGAIAMLLLSGGTTGLPKLIPRSHNDLAYMIKRAAELCAFGPETAFLAVLPLGHGFVNTGPGVLGALLSGGRVVVAPSPAPEVAFAAIERERVTATSAVPAIVARWLEHRQRHPAADLSSLTLLQVGAARLAPELASRIGPELGCTLQQVYGMGEGLLCLTRLDDPPAAIHLTQGRPVSPDDELLIVDDDGRAVPPGEAGVLLTRGPYTTRGYFRSPEVNAVVFSPDGWYNTGDVVRRTADGNLVIVGRDKDVINRGGEKITANEVEAFARELETVAQAAAVAMPDPELGEVVCLYVVTAPGRTVALDDVWTVMRAAGAARFKFPQRLVTVEAFPLTAMGKVDKRALRADIVRRLDRQE